MRHTAAVIVQVLVYGAAAHEAPATVPMEAQRSKPLPRGWHIEGPAPRGHLLELTFAVRQRGLPQLHDHLMRVSDPSSPDYGKHLSREQVNELTAPDAAHVATVMQFLRGFQAEPRRATPNGDFITAFVPVETAERMLAARYLHLVHNESGVHATRAIDGYRLPADVAAVVDFVEPTVRVPAVRAPLKADGNMSVLTSTNTPKSLRELYSVGEAEGKAAANRQAVTAFIGQQLSNEALKTYWTEFCSGIPCGKGAVKTVGDASAPVRVGGDEAMLDIETITGVAGNVESEFWGFTGQGSAEGEPYIQWLMKVSSTSDSEVPKIFSTSYGGDEDGFSLAVSTRLNVEYQKAGLRGISILFASGDEGANCEGDQFVPEGPASSPYVTAVGATGPTSGFPEPGSEEAIGLSSGGFSNYFPMPDYQKSAVEKYLTMAGLPSSSNGYNTGGRAYPDIAAQGTNFIIYTSASSSEEVAGTSCASPTAAAIFSLLNDARLAAGKSTLGFLNPLIYQHASSFNDVTTGSSTGGCTTEKGWPAKLGWDAVTGVGTPNFAKLLETVMELPAGFPEPGEESTIVV